MWVFVGVCGCLSMWMGVCGLVYVDEWVGVYIGRCYVGGCCVRA